MDTNTGNIEEKFQAFMETLNSFVESQKLPAWAKSFIDMIKTFFNDITISIHELEGSQLPMHFSLTVTT